VNVGYPTNRAGKGKEKVKKTNVLIIDISSKILKKRRQRQKLSATGLKVEGVKARDPQTKEMPE